MKHKLDVTINELRLKSIRKIVKRINIHGAMKLNHILMMR